MKVYKIRLIAAALVVGSLGSLAACGGGGGRPSADKIADTMTSESSAFGNMPKDAVKCMAEAFHDSDLSDGFLNAMVDKKKDYKPSDKDTKALASVTTEAGTKCASEMAQ